MRRIALALVVVVCAAALPAAAALAESQPYEMYFPLVGGGVPTDDFGDPRGDHTHEGNDILAPKMTEVVAVSAGTVGWVSDECCAFELLHDDGWSSWYIHLNNDSPDTDDGLGWGMVDGIEPGATIEAGQLVGWVGDSGNAEDAEPHLHFELHRPNGEAIDPQKHLLAATVLDQPIGGSPKKATPTTTPLVEFLDIAGSVHAAAIGWLAAQGITNGCTPDGTSFCPMDPVSRDQMASFLVRAMQYDDPGEGDLFWDDDGSTHEASIDRLVTAGVTEGCDAADPGRFCPGDEVTREQMASFLVRSMRYSDDGAGDLFTDDDGSTHEKSIDRLATAGVTTGCNPPENDQFCPSAPVTRGQMASFLFRALGDTEAAPSSPTPAENEVPWEASVG
jgi:hypothetical protein